MHMIKIDIPQGTPGWHRWRSKGVTASNAAVILGISPHKTALELWRELVGLCDPADLSMIAQVRKGHLLEPLALEWFQKQYGSVTGPCCGESVLNPVMRASFDAFWKSFPLEIKNLSETNHLEVLNERKESSHYKLYFWQVQHQMYVSGQNRGYLLFWNPHHTPVCFEIERCEDSQRKILKASLEFFKKVQSGVPPDFDLTRDTCFINRSWEHYETWRKESAQFKSLLDMRAKLSKELKFIKNKIDERKLKLIPNMGNHYAVEGAGLRLCQSQSDGAINWEMVAKSLIPESEHYRFEDYRSQGSSSVRVSLSDKDIDDSSVLKPDQKPQVLSSIAIAAPLPIAAPIPTNDLSFDW